MTITNNLPTGYTIENYTHTHTTPVGVEIKSEGYQVFHHGMHMHGAGANAWWSKEHDAREDAWGHYNQALIDSINDGLEDNHKALGVYVVEDGNKRAYHAVCIDHEVLDLMDLERITIWDEGYDVVRIFCFHCAQPICDDELSSKYRLSNEGCPQDDEEEHLWALEDGRVPHDGEYIETCERCRLAAEGGTEEE